MLSNRRNTRIHSFKLFPENSTILSWLVTKCTLFTWWQIAQLSALNEHILLLVNWEGGILIASVEWHCTMLCINNGWTLTFVQNVGNLHTEHTHQAPDKPFTERNLIVDCKRCLLSFQSPCCPADLGNLLQTGNCCQNWFISDQGVWLMMACFERTLQFCTKLKSVCHQQGPSQEKCQFFLGFSPVGHFASWHCSWDTFCKLLVSLGDFCSRTFELMGSIPACVKHENVSVQTCAHAMHAYKIGFALHPGF